MSFQRLGGARKNRGLFIALTLVVTSMWHRQARERMVQYLLHCWNASRLRLPTLTAAVLVHPAAGR